MPADLDKLRSWIWETQNGRDNYLEILSGQVRYLCPSSRCEQGDYFWVRKLQPGQPPKQIGQAVRLPRPIFRLDNCAQLLEEVAVLQQIPQFGLGLVQFALLENAMGPGKHFGQRVDCLSQVLLIEF